MRFCAILTVLTSLVSPVAIRQDESINNSRPLEPRIIGAKRCIVLFLQHPYVPLQQLIGIGHGEHGCGKNNQKYSSHERAWLWRVHPGKDPQNSHDSQIPEHQPIHPGRIGHGINHKIPRGHAARLRARNRTGPADNRSTVRSRACGYSGAGFGNVSGNNGLNRK